jgi:hypothetical protein
VFLAHFTGGGIHSVLKLSVGDFLGYLEAAEKLYEVEAKFPLRVVLAGMEKR